MKFAKSQLCRPAARLRAAFLLTCLLACGLGFLPAAQAQTPPAQSGVIDANAKLHVTVANEAQLTGDYTVDPQGDITMLYINQVHVQGLTPAQAAAVIRGATATGGKAAKPPPACPSFMCARRSLSPFWKRAASPST